MKRCSKCAEKIQNAATVCRFCGADQPPRESRKVLILVVGAALGLVLIGSQFRNRETPSTPAVAKANSAPGDACKGFHGEARNFAGLVKEGLRNPASFEHVGTVYGPVNDGVMVATMRYRATNGHGATDTYTAIGEVRVNGCGARVLKAEA